LRSQLTLTSKSGQIKILAAGLTLVLFTILFWGYHFLRPPQAEAPSQFLKADGIQHLRIACHLVHHGVFSKSACSESNPAPTAYRLPVYPFLLSLWMRLVPHVEQGSPGDPLRHEMLQAFHWLIHAQVFIFFLTTLCCGLIVRLITRSWIAACVSLFVIGFDKVLWDWSRHVTAEVLLCFLVAAVSLTLVLCVQRRGLVWHLLAGVLLAVLCLTRGYFQYFIPVGVIFLLVNAWQRTGSRQRDILGVCVFALVPLLAVQAWKARNYVHFDRWYLTDRGGAILDMRAGLDMVNRREYQASFLYYSRSPYLLSLLEKHFEPAAYRRFGRDEEMAKHRRQELLMQYGSMAVADKVQLSEALQKIKAHPIKHLLMCFPLAIRGLGGVIPFTVGLSTLGLLVAFSVFRRRGDIGSILVVSLFSYGFCTMWSHNLARYNIPIVPMIYVGVVLIGFFVARKIRHHVRQLLV